MALSIRYNERERSNITQRLGNLFKVANLGLKMTDNGWRIESHDKDTVWLTVVLCKRVSVDEAAKLINAEPLTQEDLSGVAWVEEVLEALPVARRKVLFDILQKEPEKWL